MGFEDSAGLFDTWRGPALSADRDDVSYWAMTACVLSRLGALGADDPNREFGEVRRRAEEFVDDSWRAASGEALDADNWSAAIDSVYESLGNSEPFAIIVGVAGHRVRRGDTVRRCWELAATQLHNLVVDPVLHAWRETRFPGPAHAGATHVNGRIVFPWSQEQLRVRSELPLLSYLNLLLDEDAEAVIGGVGGRSSLQELRVRAEESGALLGAMAQRARRVTFPAPDAPFDDVVAALRAIER